MSFEYLINKILKLDPQLQQYLQPLAQSSVQITCTDFPQQVFYCLFDLNYIAITKIKPDNAIDVQISGSLSGLLNLALKKHATDFRREKIYISGDLRTAELMQKLFFQLDLDWEEALSKYTGDVIAHQAIFLIKQIRQYQQQQAPHLQQMVKEYLQEESGILPTAHEIEEFIYEVDQLRIAVDRLEARIKQYESSTALT